MAYGFNNDRSKHGIEDTSVVNAVSGTDYTLSGKVSLGFLTYEKVGKIVILDFLLNVNDDIEAGESLITINNLSFLPRRNVYGVSMLLVQQSRSDSDDVTYQEEEGQIFVTTNVLSLVKDIEYKADHFNRLRGHFVFVSARE